MFFCSFRIRTGKGPSSRRAKSISTWACPTSCGHWPCSKAHPDYRFVLDQVCYVRPFLERYPEEAAAFRQFVKEGRLAIVGGTDVMPDVNMPGGESFVRQVLYGKGYYRQKLGVDVTVGWQLDTFGHHPQMPQLLKLGGYKSFWTQRGLSDPNTPSEFLWEGIDGTQIPTFWLPQSYAVTYGSPAEWPAFSEFFQQRFAAIAPYSRGRGRVGLAGADVCEPELHVPALVEQFNRQAAAPFELRIAVPTDFEALVAQRADRPVVRRRLQSDLSRHLQQSDRAEATDPGTRAAAHDRGETGSDAALAGRADRRRDLVASLGADAFQPGARPDVGRHDRPRVRRHDSGLRFLAADCQRRSASSLASRLGGDRHAR